VQGLREAGVTVPVIGFPREAATALLEPYVEATGVQAVSLGVSVPAELGQRLQQSVAIQGALSSELLRGGGAAMDARIDALLGAWSGVPYIFNLGHGVVPDTPIEHIHRALERVTAWRNG